MIQRKYKKKINTAQHYFPQEDIDFITAQVPEILRTRLTMGEWVKRFEEEAVKATGARFAVAANSCTSALEMTVRALGIGEGDEVIVPTQTFIATAFAVYHAGAKPVFADIKAETHCLDPEDVERRITSRTRAVILVHLAGLITPDLADLQAVCRRHNLQLIEDAAHAHGASKVGRRAGALSMAGCFSFYATKVVAAGEGGVITTNDEHLYDLLRSYQWRGQDLSVTDEEIFIYPGRNVRMTEFAALCGVMQYRRLEEAVTRRNRVAEIYEQRIRAEVPEVGLVSVPPDTQHSYWKHVINLPDGVSRHELKAMMDEAYDVPIAWSYYPPVHLMPVFTKLYGLTPGHLPVAEHVLKHNVNLPMHAVLDDEDAEYIVEAFINCYKKVAAKKL